LHAALGLDLGERREVLEAQGADVERGRAGHELHVLLGRAQLDRDLLAGQRPDDVHEQARRQHDRAVADHLAVERDAQADLHVGGAQFDRAVARLDVHAGQRLHGAAGGGGAGDGLQLREQLVALGRDLHRACLAFTSSMMRGKSSNSAS
jgi:hypothetical protein